MDGRSNFKSHPEHIDGICVIATGSPSRALNLNRSSKYSAIKMGYTTQGARNKAVDKPMDEANVM